MNWINSDGNLTWMSLKILDHMILSTTKSRLNQQAVAKGEKSEMRCTSRYSVDKELSCNPANACSFTPKEDFLLFWMVHYF